MSLTTNKMFYVSWEAFHRATKELARQLLGQNFTAIVAVSRGGLVPAAIIARELNISDGTVKVHVKHLLKKLGLRSRVEAAVWMVNQQGAKS